MEEPLLLHSLLEHRDLVFACLDAAAPRRIVEIGSETGGFTKALVEWASERGATVASVEPAPAGEIVELAAANDHFELIRGRSPQALAATGPADVYVIDGDHNYWTVSRELEIAFAEPPTLAVLHDVGWPCARRDQYYAPDALPPEAVHPHSFEKGRAPDAAELVDGGFRGAGQFAVALAEGGDRNGVLTAVEDFVRDRPQLCYRHVPAIFGVGFVYPKDAPYARRVGQRLAPWHDNELLARLERNRVRMFARLLELQDGAASARLRHNRVVSGYEDRLAAAHAEIAALRLERARLRGRLEAVDAAAAG
jgi:hypothetical protein